MTRVAISRLHWPLTTLGYGRRVGIWFQGCSIGCKGCCSHDTWVATPDHTIVLMDIMNWIRAQPLEEIDGFTFSGGEPFEQPAALQGLLLALRKLPNRFDDKPRDILVYSGHPWHWLLKQHANITMLADAVISEPFVHKLPQTGLRGSSNQRLHLLTELSRARYGAQEATAQAPAMQAHFDGERLWMIGIPKRGDLVTLQTRMNQAGVTLEGVSWLA